MVAECIIGGYIPTCDHACRRKSRQATCTTRTLPEFATLGQFPCGKGACPASRARTLYAQSHLWHLFSGIALSSTYSRLSASEFDHSIRGRSLSRTVRRCPVPTRTMVLPNG